MRRRTPGPDVRRPAHGPRRPARPAGRSALLVLLLAAPLVSALAVLLVVRLDGTRRADFEDSAVAEARSVLVAVPTGLDRADTEQLARQLRRPGDLEVVLVSGSTVDESSERVGLGDVPTELRQGVLGSEVGRLIVSFTRTTVDGETWLVTGGTVPGADGAPTQVYLFFSEGPVERDRLRTGVLVGVGAATLLAFLAVGGWLLAHRRLLRVAGEREREQAFGAHLAHELRTPVGAMVTASTLVDERVLAEADEQVRQPVSVMREEALRLGRVVEDLLEVSRLQTGQVQPRVEAVDLRELLETVCSSYDWPDVELDVPARHEEAGHGPLVEADPQSLARIVVNLVANAVRHAGTGVCVEVREEDDGVVVRVADTGPGLPPAVTADLERHPDDPPSGRGLGLRVARAHAALLGTRLHADTGPDGTVVWFALPRAEVEPG